MKNKILQSIDRNYSKLIPIIKNNKILIIVVLISLIYLYFFNIKPVQIRKECSVVTKHHSITYYKNPEYNEVAERQKQKMLVDYIDCRNKNLAKGDQFYVKDKIDVPYLITQEQYNTLSIRELLEIARLDNSYWKQSDTAIKLFGLKQPGLKELDRYVLGKRSSSMFYAYNGYIIDCSTFENLKKDIDKYPQCNFPDDFEKKEWFKGGGSYLANATEEEYEICLRQHGLSDVKLAPEEIRKDKEFCYRWYGKSDCDDPNFNPK